MCVCEVKRITQTDLSRVFPITPKKDQNAEITLNTFTFCVFPSIGTPAGPCGLELATK